MLWRFRRMAIPCPKESCYPVRLSYHLSRLKERVSMGFLSFVKAFSKGFLSLLKSLLKDFVSVFKAFQGFPKR